MSTGPSPLVLAYHGVARIPFDRDRFRLFVHPDQVVRDLRWLRRRGYDLVTCGTLADRLADGGPEGARGLAALSFDDGLADNATTLLPLLQHHDAPATVFVVSGWLGGRHADEPHAPILDADGVRCLHAGGVEIGAHGVHHQHLADLGTAGVAAELEQSRRQLESVIDAPVRTAAYPFGEADADVAAAMATSGLCSAWRTSGLGSWSSPFDLPRQAMGHGSSVLGLHLKQRDRYEAAMRLPWATSVRRFSRRRHAARSSP